MFYTSGSTGNPKGVEFMQSIVCNLVHWLSKNSYSFGPRDLGSEINLLSTINHNLKYNNNNGNDDLTIQAALNAINRSYTPYTNSPSGVAILSKTNNQIYIGSYLENAAFNPSLPPLHLPG